LKSIREEVIGKTMVSKPKVTDKKSSYFEIILDYFDIKEACP
jgi:hypothetical protein